VLAALGLAEHERIAGFVPTRRHFVSSGAACNAQYFEASVREYSKKIKVSAAMLRRYAGLMQRKIYTHNEADPAAWAE
jgi:hypothetical protein